MRSLLLLVFASLVIVLLAMAAYALLHNARPSPPSDPGGHLPDQDQPLTSREAFGDDVVVIAAVSAKTGAASEANRIMFDMVHFAADRFNAEGGVLGKRLVVVELDNRSTPLGSRAAARAAVELGAVAVIGSPRSSHSLAMAPVLQASGVPMISPTATHPEVTMVGECIFRMCYVDSFQGRILAEYAYHTLGARRAVALTNTNRIFSLDLSKVFATHFTELGGDFLWDGGYLDRDTDYASLVAEVARRSPDVVFIPSESRDAGYIIKQARAAGIAAAFLGPDSWDLEIYTYGGEAVEGSRLSTHWHPHSERPESREFVTAWREHHGHLRRIAMVMAYDATVLLVDAARRAGTWRRGPLCQAIAATRDFAGVTGTIDHFDEHGDPVGRPAVILALRNGDLTYLETVEPR